VWATTETWKYIESYPLENRQMVQPRVPFQIADLTFEAFAVEHSIRCPAVSYRISAHNCVLHYAPDVVYIPEMEAALRGVHLYVGDGATMERPLVRRFGDKLVGHSAIRTQLTWCAKQGVRRAIFTHCGTQVVDGNGTVLSRKLRSMGKERGVEARFAYDGLAIHLNHGD
jgi:hypothetical protein